MDDRLRELDRLYQASGQIEHANLANAYRYRAGLELLPFLDVWQQQIVDQLYHYEIGQSVRQSTPLPIVRLTTARGLLPQYDERIQVVVNNYGFEDLADFSVKLRCISESYYNRSLNHRIYPSTGSNTHTIELVYKIHENGDVDITETIYMRYESGIEEDCLDYSHEYSLPLPQNVDVLLEQAKIAYDRLLDIYWKRLTDCFMQQLLDSHNLLIGIENCFTRLPVNPQMDQVLQSDTIKEALRSKAKNYENALDTSSGALPDYLHELSLKIQKTGPSYSVVARVVYSDELADPDETDINAETLGRSGTPNQVYDEMTSYLERQDEIDGADTHQYGETWEGDLEVVDDGGQLYVEMHLSRHLSLAYFRQLVVYPT